MIGQFGALDEQSNLKKQDLGWYQHNYIYDDTGGRGVDVYIVDTGAKLDHAVRRCVFFERGIIVKLTILLAG